MAGFIGTERYKIDEKGRIVVPASIRTVVTPGPPRRTHLLNNFVMVGSPDACVWLYAEAGWMEHEQLVSEMSRGNEEDRAMARAFLASASRVTVDKQGRISIPSSLIKRAGLGKEAVLHGSLDRIEIWAPEKFDSVLEPVMSNFPARYDRAFGRKTS